MPHAGRPASRRSSRSARACGAASALLLRGSGAVWPCGTITGASTCPTPSSRSLPFWASQARPPSCGLPREMAVPSASFARSRRTCSGCGPSTASRSSVRRCSSFGRSTTQAGSSNGTGSRHLPPCGRTSFHPRHWPRSLESGVSLIAGGTNGGTMDPRKLVYLASVIEHGSFKRAAKHLLISQPALSASMDRLEGSVGLKLLDRGPVGVTPTALGEVVYTHARLIRDEIEL